MAGEPDENDDPPVDESNELQHMDHDHPGMGGDESSQRKAQTPAKKKKRIIRKRIGTRKFPMKSLINIIDYTLRHLPCESKVLGKLRNRWMSNGRKILRKK